MEDLVSGTHVYTGSSDREVFRTGDGSATVHDARVGVTFHSMHGALRESRHVFIEQGLRLVEGPVVHVLEVGLGTGLNLLLSAIEAEERDILVHYDALEPEPLGPGLIAQLGHAALLGRPELEDALIDLVDGLPDRTITFGTHVMATRRQVRVEELDAVQQFGLIYYDPFGPGAQPLLWSLPVLQRAYNALKPGGVLVTYCAKGEVRRNFVSFGAHAERPKGPPGKREMLRITRPVRP